MAHFPPPASRSLNVDVIRIIAMLMVVVLHTILNFTLRSDFFATKVWWIFEPIVALSKTSVLLFFMLSGYLVIHKNRSIQANWQKTAQRLILPFLFFSCLNLGLAWHYAHAIGVPTATFWSNQMKAATDFPGSPLWFLHVLIILYLLNPIWQKIFEKKEARQLALYFTLLVFLCAVFSPLLKFLSGKGELFFNSFTGWLGYVFFYVYGGVVQKKWFPFKQKWMSTALIVLGLAGTIAGDYFSSLTHVRNWSLPWSSYTAEYLSLPVIMTALGLFQFLLHWKLPFPREKLWQRRMEHLLYYLATASFGVYIVHTYIITALTEVVGFDFNKLAINVYLYNLVNYGCVLVVSIFITLVTQKIIFVVHSFWRGRLS